MTTINHISPTPYTLVQTPAFGMAWRFPQKGEIPKRYEADLVPEDGLRRIEGNFEKAKTLKQLGETLKAAALKWALNAKDTELNQARLKAGKELRDYKESLATPENKQK